MAALDAGYGKGVATLAGVDRAVWNTVEDLKEGLAARFRREDYAPPNLPRVALELDRLARQPEVSYDEIEALLSSDPVLAARSLKVAQSPAFATTIAPRTLREALTRLGLDNVQQICWQVAMTQKVFRAKGYEAPTESLRQHCVATGRVAATIAGYTGNDAHHAFLAGLLHDIGAVAALLMLSEHATPVPLAWVAEAVDELHEELGEIVGAAWKLDGDLRLAIRHHHEPRLGGHHHPLATVVAFAETVVNELGHIVSMGDAQVDRTPASHLVRYASALNLSDGQVALIHEDARKLADVA